MKYTKTFRNASVVSVNQGTITIQEHCGGQFTLQQASLVSLCDGNITLNIEYPDFKKGDILFSTVRDIVFIFKEIINDEVFDLGYTCPSLTYITSIAPWDITYLQDVRYATEEEKQRLFNKVNSKYHKIWNKETLQWEKYEWEPKRGEKYYYIDTLGDVSCTAYNTFALDSTRIKFGNCFQTKEQAKRAAEKVKELLKSL